VAVPPKKQAKNIPVAKSGGIFPFPYKTKCIILCCTCFLFYANTLFNRYALDDTLTIAHNAYVQMGFSGIPKILTNDSYASYYNYIGKASSKQLSGGRFRPLSEIVFAIEQQLFGDSDIQPYFRHFINIITFMAGVIAIFYFLEKFLLKKVPWGSDIAFIATFLFIIHPLHTEVVANIKSLDELLSMLFIMLTFIYSLTYLQSRKTNHLVWGSVYFFLALLSKEYAVTLVFFIPLLFYLLGEKKPESALAAAIPYYGVFIIYLLMRSNAVGLFGTVPPATNVYTNPYFFATPAQKIATEWFVLGNYLKLLLLPYPLASDYSYYQIPYHSFSDITVLLSLAIYIGIFAWVIILLRKKNILSFAVFFFLLNIFMVSNFLLDIGATMGERLAFHSSLGLVIILSYYLFTAVSKMPLKTKKNVVIGIMSVIGVVCLGETVTRNAQWRDDTSLFIHDAGVSSNSFLVNNNASCAYITLSQDKALTTDQVNIYLDSARKYALKALSIYPKFDMEYRNLGDTYYLQGMLDSAARCWEMVKKLNPNYPDIKQNFMMLCQAYFSKGLDVGHKGNPRQGIILLKKALAYDSANSDIWYNIGGAYFTEQLYDSARYAWLRALQYKPGNADAKRGLASLIPIKKDN